MAATESQHANTSVKCHDWFVQHPFSSYWLSVFSIEVSVDECSADFSCHFDTLFRYFFPAVISCPSKHYFVRQSVSCGGGRLLLQTGAGKIWSKTPQKTSHHKSEGYLWTDLLQGCLLFNLQHIWWLRTNFPSPDNEVLTSGQQGRSVNYHHYQFLCLTCENVTMRLQDTI